MLTTKFDAQLTSHATDIAVATYLKTKAIKYMSTQALYLDIRVGPRGTCGNISFTEKTHDLLL